MNLLSLPREVLILVLHKLDTPSLYAVYNTCLELKSLITDFSNVKACSFSLNNMSSRNSLKLHFFTALSGHLQQLDLSGVPDLTRTSVLPVMKKLVRLRTLNIQFTNLNLMDFIDIHRLCPTIRDISIELEFGSVAKYCGRNCYVDNEIPDIMIEMCQETFRHMENVHFTTTSEIALFGALPHIILKDCEHLADVTVTAWRNSRKYQLFERLLIEKPTSLYKQWFVQVDYSHINIMSLLPSDSSAIEFIVILNCERRKAKVSAGLKDFWEKNIDISYEYVCVSNAEYTSSTNFGAVHILKWPRASNFDVVFYCKLMKQLRRILPTSAFKNNSTEKDCWDVSMMTQSKFNEKMPQDSQPNQLQFKKKRIAPSSKTLDFEQYKDMESLKLRVVFVNLAISVTLSSTSSYLKKLTSLTLSGVVRYSDDFFRTLFSTCNKLTTLHVIAAATSNCFLLISKSVKLNSSLKNLRLVGGMPKHVLSDLSDCRSIEILFLEDDLDGKLKTGIKDLLLKLPKLRVLYMTHIEMTDACRTRSLKYIEDLKIKCERQSVDIVLNTNSYSVNKFIIYHGVENYTIIKGLSYAFMFLTLFNLTEREKYFR